MQTHAPHNSPDPDNAIRQEFSQRLMARLNAADVKPRYDFIVPSNPEVIQVDQGQLTGHVYGLFIKCRNGFRREQGMPAIAHFMEHLLTSMASALADSGIAVYFKETFDKGPDGRMYPGKTFIVHNTVSNANNPMASQLFFNKQLISGNQPERLNLYQITLQMQGQSPGPILNTAVMFVDRLRINPATVEQQHVTPERLTRRVGKETVEYLRYSPAARA